MESSCCFIYPQMLMPCGLGRRVDSSERVVVYEEKVVRASDVFESGAWIGCIRSFKCWCRVESYDACVLVTAFELLKRIPVHELLGATIRKPMSLWTSSLLQCYCLKALVCPAWSLSLLDGVNSCLQWQGGRCRSNKVVLYACVLLDEMLCFDKSQLKIITVSCPGKSYWL